MFGIEPEKISDQSMLMNAYSSTLDKAKYETEELAKYISSRAESIPHGTMCIINTIVSEKPKGLKFKNISIEGRQVVIEAMARSSEDISIYSKKIAENILFDTIEVSEVKRSSIDGYMDFRITTLIRL